MASIYDMPNIPNLPWEDGGMSNGGGGMSAWDKFGLGTGVGAMLGGGLSGMFGGKNPGNAASNYYDQIPGTVSPYYQPYIGAGNSALPQLQQQFQQLMQNPNAVMNLIGSGYQQSPGYEFAKNQALQAIDNRSAAGGMSGTPENQQLAGQMATQLANQDYWNYMQNAMGLYGTGLQGEEGLAKQGYNASDTLAQLLGGNLAQQGGLAYKSAADENARRSQGFENIFGGLGALGAALML